MASERQVEANRRNARKSTGPKSRGGKKRASRNAYRHGLSVSFLSNEAFADEVAKVARKIVGDTDNPITLEYARAIAHAELDLARVRRIKVGLIERVRALGAVERPQPFVPTSAEGALQIAANYIAGIPLPKPPDPVETMPHTEPERLAEAVRRILPGLVKLNRYERSATARRDRAVRAAAERGIRFR